MQDYVGKQIDRYRITERLGMGGMAVVYKAYDTRLERDVALKLIRTESIPQDQHERLFKRFEREAKAQASFKHPHIVAVHDYGEVDNSPFLVMDFISGGTLKDRLHGPVDWRQAVRWLIPVAEALAYAHQRGIVHRDVKPANILFDEEDQPILTDFGIAKVLETDEATLTGTGLGVGTPEYMAPEQWQGKTSEATDQYALGVALYELITGKKPFSADTPAAIILMQANEPLQAPSKLVSGIPEAVEKALYKALARDPQDRYENMEEFALALRRLLTEVDAAEPILPQKERRKPGPVPVPQADDASESVTRDKLDATPVEEINATPRGKRELPKWALWAGAGLMGVIVIAIIILVDGSLGKNSDKPLSMLVTKTPFKEKTLTPSQTATITLTPTMTVFPTPTLGIGSTRINDIDEAEMVYVPEGEFLMGIDNGSDESPQHTVFLDSYWIYKYEVANSQYRQFIEETGYDGDINQYPDNNFPAIHINWYEANTYCQWANGSLPTEAQWEKAARGIDGRSFPWGKDDPDCESGQLNACPGNLVAINSYPNGVSPYGAFNMSGNAWEWVSDWYSYNYYQNSPTNNPQGPDAGVRKVIRGGSSPFIAVFYYNVSARAMAYPLYEDLNPGFRCVITHIP